MGGGDWKKCEMSLKIIHECNFYFIKLSRYILVANVVGGNNNIVKM